MLSFFPRDVLDEILYLIESVSEGFPPYSFIKDPFINKGIKFLDVIVSLRTDPLLHPFLLISKILNRQIYVIIITSP